MNKPNHFEKPFQVGFDEEDLLVLSSLDKNQVRSWAHYFLTHDTVSWNEEHTKQIYSKEELEFGTFFFELLDKSNLETAKFDPANLKQFTCGTDPISYEAAIEGLASFFSPWLIAFYIAFGFGDVYGNLDSDRDYCGAFDKGIASRFYYRCCLRLLECLEFYEIQKKYEKTRKNEAK